MPGMSLQHLGLGLSHPMTAGAGGAAPASPPLDGLSPTGAWSMSRDLLTSFIGGSRYTDVSGAVSALNDQSGSARHLAQGTAGSRPLVTTAGPNSIVCADFDGAGDVLASTATLADFITASSGYIVVSVIIDALTRNFANARDNHPIVGTSGATPTIALYGKLLGGTTPTVYAHNRDNSDDQPAGQTISTGTAYVLEWRHDGGNVYLRVNGGTETSVASGDSVDIGALTQTLRFAGGSSVQCNMKGFEMAVFSAVPSLSNRDAIVADFMTHIGI